MSLFCEIPKLPCIFAEHLKLTLMRTLLIFCFIVIAQFGAAQITLKFNPEQGSKYSYQTIFKQDIKHIMGQNIDIIQDMGIVYDMAIEGKTSEEINVSFVHKEITFESKNPMMHIDYNSKIRKENPDETELVVANIFDAMIDVPFNVVFASNGEIKAINGTERLVEALANAGGTSPASAAMVAAFKEQYGEEAQKKSFEQLWKIYPDKPVNVGESWKISMSIPVMVTEIRGDITYTLKSTDEKNAYLDVSADLKMQSENESMPMDVNGSQAGTMTVDLATGVILNSEITQSFSGTVMGLPLEIVSENKLSITKK